jgi:RHS repeat-associated protein
MRGEVSTIRPIVPTPRGNAEWFAQSVEYYADNPDEHRDRAQSGAIGSGQETWMQTTVVGPGNVSFYYKMSSVSGDALAFYVDEDFKASWSQGSSWPWTGNFAVPSGTHTLKWKYYKYSGSTAGSCWIDAIQWSGGVPASGGGADWEQITYTYDPSGRRIAKDVDGVVTKYVYDGDQCIAEYDGSDNLLRKYIHGPSIDEPICMVEAAGGYAGTYYYHFDALGSVVALSDADGDTVQVYEYDVYGQVAASDPNHPNRFLFTGREFDAETGLYYYRARYYNPTIGRFLQTDPIGYGDGMNWYAYCGNNATNTTDPSGLGSFGFLAMDDPAATAGMLTFAIYSDDGSIWRTFAYGSLEEWMDDVKSGAFDRFFSEEWKENQAGWKLSGGDEDVFWQLQTLIFLCGDQNFSSDPENSWLSVADWISEIENAETTVTLKAWPGAVMPANVGYNVLSHEVSYYPDATSVDGGGSRAWHTFPGLAILAHELEHAHQHVVEGYNPAALRHRKRAEQGAMRVENLIRHAFYTKVPGWEDLVPRPGYSIGTADMSWAEWSPYWLPDY